MTPTLRTAAGFLGHAYVAGRDKTHAELAAVCDALLQDPETNGVVAQVIIEPLAEITEEGRRANQATAAATKVEFFTLVRGED